MPASGPGLLGPWMIDGMFRFILTSGIMSKVTKRLQIVDLEEENGRFCQVHSAGINHEEVASVLGAEESSISGG